MADSSTVKVPHAEKQAEQLTRLFLTNRDFQLALSAVTFLLQDVDWDASYSVPDLRRFYCYEAAMVVSYVRPFTQSRGGARPFSWKDISVKLDDAEKALHERLVVDRNKLFAHSDADYVELRRVIFRMRMPGRRKPLDFAMVRFNEWVRLSTKECLTAQQLLHRALHAIIEKTQTIDLQDAGFRLIGGSGESKPIKRR